MSSTAVDVRGLRVVRGGRPVVHDVSFRISAGSVTGLLGPNGSGKTTMLRAIVGVQVVAGGEISVLGRPAGAPELRGAVGYSTQAPAVYADLTVGENLAYFAAVLGAHRDDVDRVVREVGLERYRDTVVSRLSGGELSRASLAAALLGGPRLLILDEPTVGLDPVLRHELWTMFHDLAGRGGTLLVSSHVMDEAARCDRLLLMRDGRLLADDTPDGLRRRTGADDLEEAFLRLVAEQHRRQEQHDQNEGQEGIAR